MSEINLVRPLLIDSIKKFRFGSAALILKHLATLPSGNKDFINHLATIYENLHILIGSPERSFLDIKTFSIPFISEEVNISEIERRHFENEVKSFKVAVSKLETGPFWASAGSLLKCYYCLCNGANSSALICLANTVDNSDIEKSRAYPRADILITDIEKYIISSLKVNSENTTLHRMRFSFYNEFDQVRYWIKENSHIDIYEIQKNISPIFRFGGTTNE